MKPRQRLLRANPQTVGQENLSAVDLLLHLTCAADIAREEIYRPLQDTARLSEGKLSLLMTLKDAGGEMSIGMLAQHLGVTDATTSIMISRMLKEAQPLVERSTSKLDRRAFSETLTQAEQLLLVGLLKKLIAERKPE